MHAQYEFFLHNAQCFLGFWEIFVAVWLEAIGYLTATVYEEQFYLKSCFLRCVSPRWVAPAGLGQYSSARPEQLQHRWSSYGSDHELAGNGRKHGSIRGLWGLTLAFLEDENTFSPSHAPLCRFLAVCWDVWSSHSLCDRLIWPCTAEPTGLLPKAATHHTWGRHVAGWTFKLIGNVTVHLPCFLPKVKWGKALLESVVIQCLPLVTLQHPQRLSTAEWLTSSRCCPHWVTKFWTTIQLLPSAARETP